MSLSVMQLILDGCAIQIKLVASRLYVGWTALYNHKLKTDLSIKAIKSSDDTNATFR